MAAQRPPGFRGRTSEREVLDRLLETVRGGQSAALVIRGEAGVGKTALLGYAARQASGFRIAQIAGVESEMELPFAGLHQLCAPLLGKLEALPEPQQVALSVAMGLSSGDAPDGFLVALAALSLLAEVAAERPLLCLVDDAQWLDGASRARSSGSSRAGCWRNRWQWCSPFATRATSASWRACQSCRSEGSPRRTPVRCWRPSIPGPLDQRVRDRILAETRGNPLALLELPRGMSAGGACRWLRASRCGRRSGSYRGLTIGGGLVRLPEATQRLMLLAASDSVGDATLVWRAAATLGIERAGG